MATLASAGGIQAAADKDKIAAVKCDKWWRINVPLIVAKVYQKLAEWIGDNCY